MLDGKLWAGCTCVMPVYRTTMYICPCVTGLLWYTVDHLLAEQSRTDPCYLPFLIDQEVESECILYIYLSKAYMCTTCVGVLN